MNTENFTKLIRELTGRPFDIYDRENFLLTNTLAIGDILLNKEYVICLILPIGKSKIWFKWTTPKDEENLLRSFVTAFTSKYLEPNPASYSGHRDGNRWENWDEKKRESAFGHHKGFMYDKEDLQKQIESRFKTENMRAVFIKHGFYYTDYGIGIFCLFGGKTVEYAINEMNKFLKNNAICFTNEYSKARWVFRFKLGLTREMHGGILNTFSNN